jgi:hypothetical protein
VNDTEQQRSAEERDERWHLEDEREFLQRSLDDAASEHEAGDMDDSDHEVLMRRDRARLATVTEALAAFDADEPHPPVTTVAATNGAPADGGPEPLEQRARRPRGRTALGVVGVLALLAGGVLLLVHLAAPRLPGQTPTGGVTVNGDQLVDRQLEQATVLVQQNKIVNALKLYHQILTEDPTRPEALAESGWLEWEAGQSSNDTSLMADGRASVDRSVTVAPTFYAGHLFLGTIELQGDHDPTAAVTQYRLFLADHPPAQLVTSAAPFIENAFTQVHQPLPKGVAAPGG